jgi:putative ABC transport system ATP-binding protein
LLTPLTRSQRKHAVEVALDLVGLTGRQKHKPRELSGGEQQRVAIARAIVGDPAILVCDEPTGDLDRKNASEIVELLSLLNKHHGKTIVLATHDPKVAESAQQILVLEKERDGFNSQGQRHDFS